MVMISLAKSRAALVAGSIAAGAAFLGAGALITSPALAGQKAIKVAATVDAHTECSKFKVGELFADTECEIIKGKVLQKEGKALRQEGKALRQEGKALRQEGKALDKQISAGHELKACLIKIKSALDKGEVTRDTIKSYGKNRACELAKSLG